MKNVLVGVVAALALSWAGSAAAQITGNYLFEHVAGYKKALTNNASGTDWAQASFLHGFVAGVALTLDSDDPKTCLPQGSNTGQWTQVLIQYLEANPAELHKSGTTLAIAAFRKAFPCR